MDLDNLKYGPYSPSRLETGLCGKAFYAQYIAKTTTRVSSLPQDRGSATHEVLEKITKKIVANPAAVFSETELRSWVGEAVNKYPSAYDEIPLLLEMGKKYAQNPPKLLPSDTQTEVKIAIKFDKVNNKFVECDYEDPKAVARGRADIFVMSDDTTQAYIIDHKTQPNIETADTFQMRFYAWVIFKHYPFLQEIKTLLHFARYGVYSPEKVWVREDMKDIEEEILCRIYTLENRENWDCTSNNNCQYCPLLLDCDIFKDVIEPQEKGWKVKANSFLTLGDTNKAVQLAELITVIEEVKKQATASLKEHVKQSSPIATQNKVYSFVADTTVDWDKANKLYKKEIYNLFVQHNLDPLAFMGMSQTLSKGIWLIDNPTIKQELAKILPQKTTTEFGGKKI